MGTREEQKQPIHILFSALRCRHQAEKIEKRFFEAKQLFDGNRNTMFEDTIIPVTQFIP